MEKQPPQPFTAVMWNILYPTHANPDIPPQSERLKSVRNIHPDKTEEYATLGIIDTLRTEFPEGIDIGVLLEVEGDHGPQISEALGYGPGVWEQHSRKNEYLGVFGRLVDPDAVTFHDIGHNKKAVKARIGDVAFIGTHLKRPHNRQHLREQNEQATALAELIKGEEKVAVMLDSNSHHLQYPRRVLGRRGLTSVYPQTGEPRPAFPAPTYQFAMPDLEYYATKIIGRHFAIDDIMTKGLTILEAGAHEGLSDHRLLYARGRLD